MTGSTRCPAESDSEVDVERVPAIDVTQFGLEGSETVPCLPIRLQIAQKLHACTARRSDGKNNDRFRDLIDIILLPGLVIEEDPTAVDDACVEVFAARDEHRWPPSLVVPASWPAPFARLAGELEFEVDDVEEAAVRVRGIIDEIDRAHGPWTIVLGPEEVRPLADHARYRCVFERDDDTQEVFVESIDLAGWAGVM